MNKVQEMTKAEFVELFLEANDGDLVAENIQKRYSPEIGWYVANAGDCDGGDAINFWFEQDADEETGYVAEIDACI